MLDDLRHYAMFFRFAGVNANLLLVFLQFFHGTYRATLKHMQIRIYTKTVGQNQNIECQVPSLSRWVRLENSSEGIGGRNIVGCQNHCLS